MPYSLAFSQAIAVVTFVAVKHHHGIHDFVPTKDISHALNIAGPSTVKILQNLSRAGLIETREGSKGGVRLARSAESITLLHLLHAIEQERPLFRRDLDVRLATPEVAPAQERLNTAFEQAERAMKAELGAVRITDLYH